MNNRILPLRSAVPLLLCAVCRYFGSEASAAVTVYSNDFDTEGKFVQFTPVDKDGDMTTWSWNAEEHAAYSGSVFTMDGKVDDWLVSPAVSLTAGQEYSLKLKAKSGYDGSTYAQEFRVLTGRDVADLNGFTTVKDAVRIEGTQYTPVEVYFTVPESGDYHIAIQLYHTAFFYGLTIDDFELTALADPNSPAAVEDFTVKAGNEGEMKADISFRLPTNTNSGAELTSIDNAKIFRGEKCVKEIASPHPGDQVTFTDDLSAEEAGLFTYRAVAESNSLSGSESSVTLWIGFDLPGAPESFTVTDNLDGSARFEWIPAKEDVTAAISIRRKSPIQSISSPERALSRLPQSKPE